MEMVGEFLTFVYNVLCERRRNFASVTVNLFVYFMLPFVYNVVKGRF